MLRVLKTDQKDTAESGGDGGGGEDEGAHQQHHATEQNGELAVRQLGASVVHEGVDLTQTKHSQSLQTSEHIEEKL